MRQLVIAAGLGGVILLSAGTATSADNEAGVPLTPAEAAGSWTVETGGHPLCVVTLGTTKAAGQAYRFSAPASCGDAVPAGAVGWTPSADGMALVDTAGQTLVDFNRWSNSLFVSHRSSGVDVQLRRGLPNP